LQTAKQQKEDQEDSTFSIPQVLMRAVIPTLAAVTALDASDRRARAVLPATADGAARF